MKTLDIVVDDGDTLQHYNDINEATLGRVCALHGMDFDRVLELFEDTPQEVSAMMIQTKFFKKGDPPYERRPLHPYSH